jgi:hypothetical protein
MDRTGLATTVKVFDGALQRDPGSAYRWCETGELLLRSGKAAEASKCYVRAGELAPHDVRILLDMGDFYVSAGKPKLALKAFQEILHLTGAPSSDILTANIFGYYEGMKVRQNHLLDEAIPDSPNAEAYLSYVEKTGDLAGARDVWEWASARGFDTDAMALHYTGFLYYRQQYELAQAAWARHFAARKDGYPESSAIFNGGMENEATSGAFDWQPENSEGFKATRDRQIRHDGEYSYRIDFTGNKNLNFRNFRQSVYARPGKYHFTGWMRTQNISSDEGIRFRLRTARDNSVFGVETPALTGTNDWTRLEADIDVPSGTPLVEVDIARRPSLRIDNQFHGTVWFDSIKLVSR